MSQTASKSSVLAGASWYLLEKVTRLIGAFLIGAWVARYLGPVNFGALAYALALVTFLGFLGSWGIESLVVRDLVLKSFDQRRIVSTYFFVRLGGALFVPVLAVGYLAITDANDRLLMILAALFSGSVILGAFDAADCWLQANHKARSTSSIRLLGFLVGGGVKCWLIVAGASVEWFAAAVLCEAGVIAVLYFWLMCRNDIAPSTAEWSSVEFKRMVVNGKVMALSALAVVAYSKVDVLVIGALFSREALGPYAIAASMAAAWNMVGISLVQAWAPRISLAIATGQERYITELRNMLLVAMGVSVAGSGFLFLCASFIFDLLLGDAYALGVPIFKVLVWSSVFVFLGVATSQIIVNERIYWVSLFRTSVGAVFSLVSIAPVAMAWGLAGIAGLIVASSAAATLSILFSESARTTLAKVVASVQGLR